MTRDSAATAAAFLMLALLACGEPAAPGASTEPISGAALDAIQQNVRAIVAREFGEGPAESVRVERTEDGQRAVLHASLRPDATPADHERVCGVLSEAAGSVLTEGQSIEVYLLQEGSVVHTCPR